VGVVDAVKEVVFLRVFTGDLSLFVAGPATRQEGFVRVKGADAAFEVRGEDKEETGLPVSMLVL